MQIIKKTWQNVSCIRARRLSSFVLASKLLLLVIDQTPTSTEYRIPLYLLSKKVALHRHGSTVPRCQLKLS